MLKIHLHNCCYNRPFDDLSQERIHFESEAIYSINEKIPVTVETKLRSKEIMSASNISSYDSLHIAIAESAGIDILLTTDDKFEKMANKIDLKVKVMNPLKFILEMM